MTARCRSAGERGSAALELPFVLGTIVVPFALLVLQLPVWVERQGAATDAAAEVARAVAIGETTVDPKHVLAVIESSHGLPAGALHSLTLDRRGPGEPIVVSVTVDIPTLTLPVFGSIGRRLWTTSHVERRPDFGSVEP